MLLSSFAMAIVVSVALTVAVGLQQWTLATALGAMLVSAALLVAADASRQARLVRRRLQKMAQRTDRVRSTAVSDMGSPYQETMVQTGRADMLGAVRVLQAQYTARLDHLQAAVDGAVAELRRDSDRGTSDGAPH